MLILLAAITVSALVTTKERTATKVSFNDVTPLLQFSCLKKRHAVNNYAASLSNSEEFISLF